MRHRWHFFPAVLLIILFGLAASAHAQEIFGTWKNAQYNVTMVLNRDGSFTFSGPQGQSSGRWGVQDRTFWMQDQSGHVIYYSIQGFSATQLNLADANGVPLNYTRETGSSGYSGETSGILSSVGGLQLTENEIQTGVGIIQFIIGQAIRPSEVDELRQASIEEFGRAPQEFIRQISSLRQSLQSLRQLQEPIRVGLARQMLVSEFHKATRHVAEAEKPLLIQVINRYIKVLAFDEGPSLTLTDRDVNAMIEYMEFANRMAGVDKVFSGAERIQFQKELIDKLPSLPLEQKQFLCSASLAWTLVKANWERFNAAQQSQFQNGYVDAMASQYQGGGGQIPSGGTTESKRAAIRRMARENMARQNMFQMMNNMSLQNHATMLNTIENFGGTGRYWDVVDYNY